MCISCNCFFIIAQLKSNLGYTKYKYKFNLWMASPNFRCMWELGRFKR